MVDKPEDVAVVGPVRPHRNESKSALVVATKPLSEELGKFRFTGPGISGKNNEWLCGRRTQESANQARSMDETRLLDCCFRGGREFLRRDFSHNEFL